ncbi:hypothetical protein [Protaetiibacter larvae]|uniref:Uncharacterized protein n=1 Tax=Protaetiibacter larvae TaxID=2592654 RepID=A0A5C1Y899_9MICO|nr:hypothetical protein [Protaetiibacter larvae]QEO10333.1 hypothetical protein FLP23_10135 [Protaetiibacter larvae]
MRASRLGAVGSLLVLVLGGGLAGCAAPVTASCVSWVDLSDADAMAETAVLIVAGVADPADGTVELFSGPGDRHRVVVEEVLKGDFSGDELWAAAPRDYCVAEPPQPATDPIPSGERILLFLLPASRDPAASEVPDELAQVEAWRTLTPLAGVLPFPEGSEPPFDTGR